MNTAYFAVLARAPRDAALRKALSRLPYRFEFVHSVDALLALCLRWPPQAVLLDLHALTQLGALRTGPLFEMAMSWPVMRCAMLPDETINVLCAEPAYCGPLPQALEALAAGDLAWQRPQRRRKSLGVSVEYRARLRLAQDNEWQLANVVDLSIEGASLVTYAPASLDAALAIELWDLLPQPVELAGTVVWTRGWAESCGLPLLSVTFDPTTITDTLREAMGKPEHIAQLKKMYRPQMLADVRLPWGDSVSRDAAAAARNAALEAFALGATP